MKQVAISEFKAKCLDLLDQVQKTKTPLLITRHGKPIAEVVPASKAPKTDWIGSMGDRVEILGDIVAPAIGPGEWEALRD